LFSSVRQTKLATRQLLGARYYSPSNRIVSYQHSLHQSLLTVLCLGLIKFWLLNSKLQKHHNENHLK